MTVRRRKPRRDYVLRPKEQIREILIFALSDLVLHGKAERRDLNGRRRPIAPRPYMVWGEAESGLECALKEAAFPELTLALFRLLIAWDRKDTARGCSLFDRALEKADEALEKQP
jgi:hypothetical protein